MSASAAARRCRPLLRAALLMAGMAMAMPGAVGQSPKQFPQPRLSGCWPPGGRQSSEVTVTIGGVDLAGIESLVFSHPGITGRPQVDPQTSRPVANTFKVTIAGTVPPGVHELRAAGGDGLTNGWPFHVTTLDEVTQVGGSRWTNPMPVSVGSVVSGRATVDDVNCCRIRVAAGQRVLVDCWAQRIDSPMVAMIIVRDARGREVRRAVGKAGEDPVVSLAADADTDFVVGVSDFTLRGGEGMVYRLAIDAAPRVDFVFPPVGLPGTTGTFAFYGRNLPGGRPSDGLVIDGSKLERLEAPVVIPAEATGRPLDVQTLLEPRIASIDTLVHRIDAQRGASNPVLIGLATAPVVVEQEPNDTAGDAQKVSVPCEFVGQFYPRADRDWLEFTARGGEVYTIEVISHRAGVDTDPVLSIEAVPSGPPAKTPAPTAVTVDDVAPRADEEWPRPFTPFSVSTRDPLYRLEVPADGTYRIRLHDVNGESRSDPRAVYRLAIRKERPGFQVFVVADCRPNRDGRQLEVTGARIGRGESMPVKVRVIRQEGFTGDVVVTARDLPAGVTCADAILGGSAEHAELILTADASAMVGTGTIHVIGKAMIDGREVVREARYGRLVFPIASGPEEQRIHSRLTRDLTLAVIGREAAARVVAGDGKPLVACRGSTLTVPVRVMRHGEFKASLKLRASGLPKGVTAPELEIAGDEASLGIQVTGTAVPGTYTLHLAGRAVVKHAIDPGAEGRARNEKAEADKAVVALTAEAGASAKRVTAAVQAEAAAKAKGEPAQAAAAAERSQAEAESKAVAQKLEAARARVKAAEAAVQAAALVSTPQDYDTGLVSTPVYLRVVAMPIRLTAAAGGAVKQGGRVTVTVGVERSFGFDGPVQVALPPGKSAAGTTAAALTIPAGMSQGTMELTVPDTVPPGRLTLSLQGTVKFNNVPLDETVPVVLTVEPK